MLCFSLPCAFCFGFSAPPLLLCDSAPDSFHLYFHLIPFTCPSLPLLYLSPVFVPSLCRSLSLAYVGCCLWLLFAFGSSWLLLALVSCFAVCLFELPVPLFVLPVYTVRHVYPAIPSCWLFVLG
ncbi:hypothetical protein AOLI_G00054070, partial [Acnodon oligacanthus]